LRSLACSILAFAFLVAVGFCHADSQLSSAEEAVRTTAGRDAGATVGEGSRQLSLEEVVSRVKSAYSRHCCFQAAFDQLTVNVSMDLKDQFRGTLYVKKPGLIALDVESPEKQKVVIEGRSYVVHFPAEGNTVRGEIPPEVDLEHFFGFFADITKMDQNFSIDFPAASRDAEEPLIFLELTNRAKPTGSYRILLGVDRQQYIVQRAIIYDALGNYNRFNLSGVTFLDSIPDSRFRIESSQGKTSAPFAIPFFKESDSD